MKGVLCIILISSVCACQSGETVLAPGNPPLTEQMMNDVLAITEKFLELTFTAEQRLQLQRITADAWRRGDRKTIKTVLDDLKFVGKEDALRAARESNQATAVEELRRDSQDPNNAIVLAAYNAAHPDRGEIMQARGLGALVGTWHTGGSILPRRSYAYGPLIGIRATVSIILNIFSDGRFHYSWVHSHCASAESCCHHSGSAADGALSVENSKLVLEAASGFERYNDECSPERNVSQPIQQQREVFAWSLRNDPNTGMPEICLERQPFNPSWAEKSGTVCLVKHK